MINCTAPFKNCNAIEEHYALIFILILILIHRSVTILRQSRRACHVGLVILP